MPCTKTLYNELWAGNLPLTPFDVPKALRRNHKAHKARKNKRILGLSIDERPEIASLRTECGPLGNRYRCRTQGWQGICRSDISRKKTDYCIAIKIPVKDSVSVKTAMEVLRKEYGEDKFSKVFKTTTADNGSEFEILKSIEECGVQNYFAHPYSSWERAQNERHNRLFRRYVPKGASIENYTYEQIMWFANEMNDLPKRQLNYSTPA